jgi:hypothetical protein
MPGVIRRHAPAIAVLLLATACGSKSPTSPAQSTTSVQVGTAGNASTTLSPGETRQLVATATQSDGTVVDVTNLAAWQSSAPTIASVSPSGILTAAAEGSVDVSATYKNVKGTVHADVRPTCTVSLSPPAASYSAFGGSGTVNVTVNSPSCRWSARSDAPWLGFSVDGTGSGSFTYALPANSTPSARTAGIVVETSTAQRATHAITEDKPAGCSYVTQPEEAVFTASGGSGQFTVVTTPNDCRWTLVNGMSALGVSVTSGFSGTGAALVRYSVQAHTRSVDADGFLEIAGISGLNPNGRHHIVILKR